MLGIFESRALFNLGRTVPGEKMDLYLAAIAAILVGGYLLFAMFNPEKF
jgi:K+-transporting ATPase KdpF subunit